MQVKRLSVGLFLWMGESQSTVSPVSARQPLPMELSARWCWRKNTVLVFYMIRECLTNLNYYTREEGKRGKKVKNLPLLTTVYFKES